MTRAALAASQMLPQATVAADSRPARVPAVAGGQSTNVS